MSGGLEGTRLALIVAEYAYFLTHRAGLARAAVAAGCDVHVITRLPAPAPPAIAGMTFHHVDVNRSAGNPLAELRLVWRLSRLLMRIRPDIVHNVSIRLVPAGALAAAFAGVPCVVNAFTGLGYLFRSRGLKAAALRALSWPVLALCARRRGCWSVLQNADDLAILARRGLLVPARTRLIAGSGVDTDVFVPAPEADGEPVVLFAGRLLPDKGIAEFVEAARRLRERGLQARFLAAGDADPGSPSRLPAGQLAAWQREKTVEWLGRCEDMAGLYRRAHVVCLPTWHEGLPKVLLEAGACGRPVVATDIPGCRAVVTPGENGLLVPCRNAEALADALARLVQNKELRIKMGRNGRRIVEQGFAEHLIVKAFLDLYRRLRGAVPRAVPSALP